MTESIDREFAQGEFERMLKAARLDVDRFNRRFKEDAEDTAAEIIDAIVDGELAIDESGWPTFYPHTENEKLKEIRFKRSIMGRDQKIFNKAKEHDDGFKRAAAAFFGFKYADIDDDMEQGDITFLQTLWFIFLRR